MKSLDHPRSKEASLRHASESLVHLMHQVSLIARCNHYYCSISELCSAAVVLSVCELSRTTMSFHSNHCNSGITFAISLSVMFLSWWQLKQSLDEQRRKTCAGAVKTKPHQIKADTIRLKWKPHKSEVNIDAYLHNTTRLTRAVGAWCVCAGLIGHWTSVRWYWCELAWWVIWLIAMAN